jgi:DNA-binding GntR family transcriptional regulator
VRAEGRGELGGTRAKLWKKHADSEADDDRRHDQTGYGEVKERRGADETAAEGIRASGDFHLLLARVAGNAIMLRFMEELVARSSLVIALYGRSGASSCGHNDHAEIVAALRQGDADRAAVLLLTHIDHIAADLDLRGGGGLPLAEALRLSR